MLMILNSTLISSIVDENRIGSSGSVIKYLLVNKLTLNPNAHDSIMFYFNIIFIFRTRDSLIDKFPYQNLIICFALPSGTKPCFVQLLQMSSGTET